MKKHVKIILAVITLVAAGAAGLYYIMQPLVVDAIPIQPKDALLYITEQGYVETDDDYILYPEISAKVLRTHVSEGNLISAGDLILEMDASDLNSERQRHMALIQSYEAQIAIAQQTEQNQREEYAATILRLREELNSVAAQRKNAEARRGQTPTIDEQIRLLDISIEQREMQIAYAETQLQQLQALAEKGFIPRIEVTAAEQELALLKNGLASLHEQRAARIADSEKIKTEEQKLALSAEGDEEYYDALANSIVAQIYAFEEKLLKNTSQGTSDYYAALIRAENAAIAGIDPSKYRLVSPIDGTIVEFPAENRSLLSPQSPAAIIRPLNANNTLKITAFVSTRDVAALAIGQSVVLVRKLRDGDAVFSGVICDIAPRAETRISALGLEERRIKVSIIPEETEVTLGEGFDVDVKFTLIDQKDKLLVPSSAVFKHNGQDSVFIIADDVATVAAVTIGLKTGGETVLEQGIQAGAIVITDPNIEGLKDGTKVRALIE